jgi:histidinol dehydrogenase
VAAAKALVSNDCAIDFYAGPTEIVIIASTGNPEWIAADLVAQAEHDPDARSIFITWNRPLAARVARIVAATATGRAIVKQSIDAHGAIVITKNADEAVELANRIAPEHLVVDAEALAKRRLTAGALFVGPYTAQAAGDYATGSNHVLPTAGAARFRGGLSAADFVRVMAVQRVSKAGLAKLAPAILPLARAEGLRAHGESINVRVRPKP